MLSTDQEVAIGLVNNAIKSLNQFKHIKHPYAIRCIIMLSTDQEVAIGLVNNAIKSLNQFKHIKHPYAIRYAYEWVEILERIKNEINPNHPYPVRFVDLDKFSELEKIHG